MNILNNLGEIMVKNLGLKR